MGAWLLSLPVFAMSAAILVGIYLFTAAVYVLVTSLAVGERGRAFKAVSPGMLPPLAIIFALLVGFLAAQVWSETDRANVAVNREASALRGAIILASAFPGEPESRLRDLVRQHIQDAATKEWPAMAVGGATLTIIPAALAEALQYSLTLSPKNEGRTIEQREIVSAPDHSGHLLDRRGDGRHPPCRPQSALHRRDLRPSDRPASGHAGGWPLRHPWPILPPR